MDEEIRTQTEVNEDSFRNLVEGGVVENVYGEEECADDMGRPV